MSVWSEQEDNADFSTFHRAKADREKMLEQGCGPTAFRFVKTDKPTYDYALGVMPPAATGRRGFLMGEPALHNPEGQPIYYAFLFHGEIYSCALMTIEQFNDFNRPIQNRKGQ